MIVALYEVTSVRCFLLGNFIWTLSHFCTAIATSPHIAEINFLLSVQSHMPPLRRLPPTPSKLSPESHVSPAHTSPSLNGDHNEGWKGEGGVSVGLGIPN